MGPTSKLINGFKWALLEQSATQIISFAVFLLLAKLLGPKTFGQMALAQMFVMLIANVIQQGFAQSIVQLETIKTQHLNCAFWLNTAQSMLAFTLTLIFSDDIALIFNEPELAKVITALSSIFLITPLWTIQQAIFKRDLNFKPLATQALIATLAGNAIAVTLALTDFGIWALVAREISTKLLSSILLMRVSHWLPKLDFSPQHAKEILPFALHMINGNMIAFVSLQAPAFLIGYFIGTTELGYFHIAMRLVNILNDLITRTIEKVAMPTFSRLQHSHSQLRNMFYGITKTSVIVVVPIFLGLSLIIEELAPLLFGVKWIPSIASMRILLLLGIAQSMSYIIVALLIGMGHPKRRSRLLAIEAILKVAAIVAVVNQGIEAVSIAIVLAAFLALPFWLYSANKLLNIGYSNYASTLLPATCSAIIMTLTIVFYRPYSLNHEYLQLILLVCAGVGAYVISLLALFPKVLQDAMRIIRTTN